MVTVRSRDARSPGDNAEAIAAAEAAAISAARQATTRAKERALAAVLAEIIATVPLSDEACQRISELIAKGAGDS